MEQQTNLSANSNAFSRGVKTASGSLHKVIESAADAAAPAFKHVAHGAHNTVNKMADGAHYAAGAISHKGKQLHKLQHQLVKKTRSQVRKHPLLAVGIAVAGGVLLSWWLNRRRSEDDTN